VKYSFGMKDLEEEVSHERRKHNLAGLAAESALVSAQVPSLHRYRFQARRVASVRWLACVVLSASGSLQVLLAPVLLDRSARPGIDRRKFGFGLGGGRAFFGAGRWRLKWHEMFNFVRPGPCEMVA
jgi:hypothetical protein